MLLDNGTWQSTKHFCVRVKCQVILNIEAAEVSPASKRCSTCSIFSGRVHASAQQSSSRWEENLFAVSLFCFLCPRNQTAPSVASNRETPKEFARIYCRSIWTRPRKEEKKMQDSGPETTKPATSVIPLPMNPLLPRHKKTHTFRTFGTT